MNIAFLPEKVKSELGAISDKTPFLAARAYGSVEGETGEGYLVACAGKLLVFSRRAGEDNFRKLSGMFGKEISKLDTRHDKFNTFLDINIGGVPYSIKFSSSEHKELENLVESLKSFKHESVKSALPGAGRTPSVPSVKVAAPENIKNPSTLTPLEILAVALMYVSSSDSNITEDEDRCILEIFKDNKPVLGPALAYYKTHSYEEFLGNVGSLNENQKLCILSNMIEIAMKDSALHRIEQEYFRKFIKAAGLKEEQYKAINSVLFVKNSTGVLDE